MTRPERLPIIVDAPAAEPKLDFHNYAEGIAAAALDGEPARFTIGLYGPWGTGKSSLLQSIRLNIKKESGRNGRPDATVVHFDAWRYEREPHLILPLLAQVHEAVSANDSWHIKVRASIGKALRSLEVSASIPLLADITLARSTDSESRYVNPFQDLSAIGSSITDGNGAQRIVVMVDDLDRCSPAAVVNVLEAIHVLTDIDGFVFILALDYEYLVKAIRKQYKGADGHRFIEKIVQIPFRIPQLEISSDRLEELIGSWSSLRSEWFTGVTDTTLEGVALLGLRSNPRQVKRLLNSFMLTRFMKWDDTAGDPDLLLRIIGLQLAWPFYFINLHRDIAETLANFDDDEVDPSTMTLQVVPAVSVFLSEDEDVIARKQYAASSDPDVHRDLKRYLERLFDRNQSADHLRRLMDMTREIVETENDEPATSTRSPQWDNQREKVVADPAAVEDLLEELTQEAERVAEDVEIRTQRTYTVARFLGGNRRLVFATFLKKKGRVDVQVPLVAADVDDIDFSLPRNIDQTDVTTLGSGGVLVQVRPGDGEALRDAVRLMRRSLQDRARKVGVPVRWRDDDAPRQIEE
ncbi:KAP-like P-loop domain-containing protein [Microbacterium sp. AG157]|uniref:KAP family P-loop NTPase fold protein n=1 Tax=Microbacterium sp. AG157 TaxID=2183993 RepID=UPI000E258597|nr:P-loop NTPase fold protein [Microbacterium sp. AG157]REC97709.1 KAP-like P-loop domain-containing protein [Microbacterium sp. AG157]